MNLWLSDLFCLILESTLSLRWLKNLPILDLIYELWTITENRISLKLIQFILLLKSLGPLIIQELRKVIAVLATITTVHFESSTKNTPITFIIWPFLSKIQLWNDRTSLRHIILLTTGCIFLFFFALKPFRWLLSIILCSTLSVISLFLKFEFRVWHTTKNTAASVRLSCASVRECSCSKGNITVSHSFLMWSLKILFVWIWWIGKWLLRNRKWKRFNGTLFPTKMNWG